MQHCLACLSEMWALLAVQMLLRVQALITTEWGYHTARVNSVAWSPDSRRVASGALDTNAIVWTPGSKSNYTVVKGIWLFMWCLQFEQLTGLALCHRVHSLCLDFVGVHSSFFVHAFSVIVTWWYWELSERLALVERLLVVFGCLGFSIVLCCCYV